MTEDRRQSRERVGSKDMEGNLQNKKNLHFSLISAHVLAVGKPKLKKKKKSLKPVIGIAFRVKIKPKRYSESSCGFRFLELLLDKVSLHSSGTVGPSFIKPLCDN